MYRTISLNRAVIVAIALMIAFFRPLSVHAQTPSEVTMNARAGFDSYIKQGQWVPVRVTLENNGADVEGSVQVIAGSNNRYTYPVSLPAVSKKEITLYVYPDSYQSNLNVEFLTGNQVAARVSLRLNILAGPDRLIGLIASQPSGFDFLNSLSQPGGKTWVARLALKDIPENARAMSALDVLIIDDTDTGVLTQAQRQSLESWIVDGGGLIVSGGPGWQKTAAGLANLLPFLPENSQPINTWNALQAFTGSQDLLQGEAFLTTGKLPKSVEVYLKQSDLPLLIHRSSGFGNVFYLSIDPALSPFKNWDGWVAFYQKILQIQRDKPGWAGGLKDWNMALQAISALPNLSLPSGFLICGFLAFYLLIIGPVNYFVLRKMKRAVYAWISIPVLVFLFSGLTILVGNLSRGALPVLDRMAIVQVNPGSTQARVDGLVGLFSPNRSTYQLQLGSNLLAHSMPNNSMVVQQEKIFEESKESIRIPHLSVDPEAMEAVALEGNLDAPDIRYQLLLSTQGDQITLAGQLTNQSKLTLKDVVLLIPGKAEHMGTLYPGDTRNIQELLPAAQQSATAPYPVPLTTPYPYPSPTGVAPYPGPGGASPGSSITSYSYPPDTTIQEIVGNPSYYSNQNSYRRYALIGAVMGTGMVMHQTNSRGGGIYLSGWSDESPFDVSLENRKYDTIDSTLYLISIEPQVDLGKDQLTLPPGLFTWSLIETSKSTQISPYNTYLSPGIFTLRYILAFPVSYSSIKTFTLHLKSGTASGPTGMSVYLWDYQEGAWTLLPDMNWGDFNVPDPQDYVGPGGEVQLKIQTGSKYTPVQITQVDFTLVAEP